MKKETKDEKPDITQAEIDEQKKPERTEKPADTIDAHAEAIIDAIPDVTESAIEQHAAEQSDIVEKFKKVTDREGNTFNPDLHAVNADGTPKLTQGGKLAMRRGRKHGGVNSTVSAGNKQGMHESCHSNPQGMNENQLAQAAMTGKVSANLLFTMSMMIGGQDFAPQRDAKTGIDERGAVEAAFTDYYVSKGQADIPPGVALTLTIAMYVLPRFTLPTVQSNFKVKSGKLYAWWHARKARKQAKRDNKDGAQSNNGNDRKRENDAGQTISANLQK